ncbi:YkgJ family cysteine cluster protein [Moritella dasanensis]|uniref:YkgJ family cysteine cluster protein n=1 Tax=Moritella dasanensis TaxID=428031 RepID=UPI000313AD00|nr:YkgJ family cysteine cluster protein [Moritella dasanensis]
MQCRMNCGACCEAPSITSYIPGMPDGKPAGVRCVNLSADNLCLIFTDPERPALCDTFKASDDVCGTSRDQALFLITDLEIQTAS